MIERTLNLILARLKAATPRERAGLALVAAVLAIAVAGACLDWALDADARARARAEQAADLESVYARSSDSAYQQTVAADTNRVWRWSIVEASPALAQAQAVTLAEALAAQAGMGEVEVVPEDLPDADPGIRLVRLRLAADFDWSSFGALLGAIGDADTSLHIEAIEVSGGADQAPRLTLTLAAPFLQDAPS